jgi:hypothetical protein
MSEVKAKPIMVLEPQPDSLDRTQGSAKGLIIIADDFDAPMPDLEQAFEQ